MFEQISMFDIDNNKITEDEITKALLRGSGIEDGKKRIYSFFSNEESIKKQADFLKNEYGVGGWNAAIPGYFCSELDHDTQGITLTKVDDYFNKLDKKHFTWFEVAKRIKNLISSNEYMKM